MKKVTIKRCGNDFGTTDYEVHLDDVLVAKVIHEVPSLWGGEQYVHYRDSELECLKKTPSTDLQKQASEKELLDLVLSDVVHVIMVFCQDTDYLKIDLNYRII